MSLQDLRAELRDLRDIRPDLHEPELFVLWFVMAALGENDPDLAAGALVGGAGDKGVDAIYVDHDSATVSIVQGKFSSSEKGTEPLSEVVAFAALSPTLFDDDKYKAWAAKALPATACWRPRCLHTGRQRSVLMVRHDFDDVRVVMGGAVSLV